MEYNLCYDIDYKCVFDVDRVVFWATRIKDVSHRKHRVRLLYRFGPSLTDIKLRRYLLFPSTDWVVDRMTNSLKQKLMFIGHYYYSSHLLAVTAF